MQNNSNLLEESLDSLYYVYTQIDTAGVLEAQFPKADLFFEVNVSKLNYSFLKFLDSNPQLDASLKTCLKEKFTSHSYTSVYEVFHDIKLASMVKILEFENDPTMYVKADSFYKVSIEMLLRESVRLGVVLKEIQGLDFKENPDVSNNGFVKEDSVVEGDDEGPRRSRRNTQKEDFEQTDMDGENRQSSLSVQQVDSVEELLPTLEKDFDIITSSYFNSTGQALSIFASGNAPFFSSLNSLKSDMDDREPIIDPNLGATVVNVIPNVPMVANETLSKFSTESKVPNMKQILENYMHPNWLRLISSQWLKHGDSLNSLNSTFAPAYDETQSIISNDWKGLTWCQQIGFKKLVDIKQKYDVLVKDSKIVDSDAASKDESNVANTKLSEENSSKKITQESAAETFKEVMSKDVDIKNKYLVEESKILNADHKLIEKINVENILKWDANKVVEDDEPEIVESNKVQATISDLLVDLNQLRQTRIQSQKKFARVNKNVINNTNNKIMKPSQDEIKLYHKIRRLITGLIDHKSVKPNDLDLEIDSRIPVLQHTYQGTLPASFGVTGQKPKTKRRR